MSTYTFETWFISNVIHPFLMMAGLLLFHVPVWDAVIPIFFLVFTWSLAISLPLFGIVLLLLNLIVRTKLTASAQFVLWLFTTPVILLIVVTIIEIYDGGSERELFLFVIPAMMSTCITILIRSEKFQKMLSEHRNQNTVNLETSSID